MPPPAGVGDGVGRHVAQADGADQRRLGQQPPVKRRGSCQLGAVGVLTRRSPEFDGPLRPALGVCAGHRRAIRMHPRLRNAGFYRGASRDERNEYHVAAPAVGQALLQLLDGPSTVARSHSSGSWKGSHARSEMPCGGSVMRLDGIEDELPAFMPSSPASLGKQGLREEAWSARA